MNLLIEGVFDIFHQDHRRYIQRCIEVFKEKNGDYPSCLKVNVMSNSWANRKGTLRPFFDEQTRKAQVNDFTQSFQKDIPAVETTISDKAAFEYDQGEELQNKYPDYQIALCLDNKTRVKTVGFTFLEVSPLNIVHTSDIEGRLLRLKDSSNNAIRKVATIVVRDGKIIGEGVSTRGDATCSKCTFFSQGDLEKARLSQCNHPHAEIQALDGSKEDLKDAALITTTAPCLECAKCIVEKRIPLVVYLKDYIRLNNNENDTSGIQLLRDAGVSIRKAGI